MAYVKYPIPDRLYEVLSLNWPNLNIALPGNKAGDACHVIGRHYMHPFEESYLVTLKHQRRSPYSIAFKTSGGYRQRPHMSRRNIWRAVGEPWYTVYKVRMNVIGGHIIDYDSVNHPIKAKRLAAQIAKQWLAFIP